VSQSYDNIEQLIIDASSTDKTLPIAKSYAQNNIKIHSEPDQGIYDALNKGIKLASGDIIGVVHSDDYLIDKNVIADIAKIFQAKNCDYVYSNLEMIKNAKEEVYRKWVPGNIENLNLYTGWMIPHPTLFIKKEVISMLGYYNTDYKIAADYDFILRLLKHNYKGYYLNRVTYKLRCGGVSTNPKNIIKVLMEDIRVIRAHNMSITPAIFRKKFSKLKQLLG
jgi:glycosyltransferase